MLPLTAEQTKAVETIRQNICVSAGAGTGKTRVLVERFLYFISKGLAQTGEILAITFTEKASQEMKSRIADGLKRAGLEQARRELENAYISTIHAFCARILKEHPIEAGVDPEFRVIEEDEANSLKETCLDQLIESRFQNQEVFDLLHVYGDNSIRENLKNMLNQIHHEGLEMKQFSELVQKMEAQKNNDPKKLIQSIQHLKTISKKGTECDELEKEIQVPIQNWQMLEAVKNLGKKFTKAGKQKEHIEAMRGALDEWIAKEAERLGTKYGDTFLQLLNEFEQSYSALKNEQALLDFNDLEQKALYLLSQDHPRSKACRKLYQDKFKLIMVDEFQDTSPLQDRIISLVAKPDNLFLVGDWKQSIFSFRGADASLLLEKEKNFPCPLYLSENFRSRADLLHHLNSFFQHLFNHRVELKSGKPEGQVPCLELLTLRREEDESMAEHRMKEARVLAERISRMVASGQSQYGDFAMLFRATPDIYFYEHELRRYGIPYYVIGGRGFYHQPEIRDIVSFLELLENPQRDVPLAAVLKSPFVQVSDDVLFWLSHYSTRLKERRPLYEALLKHEEISELSADDQLKLKQFLKFLFRLIKEKGRQTLSQLLELILEQTKYDRYVLHLPQGKRHYANIRKLLEVAREAEARRPIHLGDFIRYVKGLEMQEVRESEAQVEALEGNVVKLMTVHKAKGLEFKVVILPDLSRLESKFDARFLADRVHGFGFKIWNECAEKFEDGRTYQLIKEKRIQNNSDESKRLLYVAMTRAMDRLILLGSLKEKERKDDWFHWIYEWMNKSAALKPEVPEVPGERPGQYATALVDRTKIKSALQKAEPIKIKISEGVAQLIESLKPVVPVRFDRLDLPVSAYAVFKHDREEFRKTYEMGMLAEESGTTDFKNEEISEAGEEELEPLSAADFGTMIHKIFEHLVSAPEKAQAALGFWLNHFQRQIDQATFKDADRLCRQFIASKQFSEIRESKKRYPEIPFVLRLRYGMIQGTLDLLYQNAAGEWIILDYKTSRELKTADRYQGQMLLYALACQELLGIKPKSALLYFVRQDQAVELSLADVHYDELREQFESLQKTILQTFGTFPKVPGSN